MLLLPSSPEPLRGLEAPQLPPLLRRPLPRAAADSYSDFLCLSSASGKSGNSSKHKSSESNENNESSKSSKDVSESEQETARADAKAAAAAASYSSSSSSPSSYPSSLSSSSSSARPFARRAPTWTTTTTRTWTSASTSAKAKSTSFLAAAAAAGQEQQVHGNVSGSRRLRNISTVFQAPPGADSTGGTSVEGQPLVPVANPTAGASALPGQEQATQQLGSGAQQLGDGANQLAGTLPPAKETLPDSVNTGVADAASAAGAAGQQGQVAGQQVVEVEQEIEKGARQEAWLASHWLEQHQMEMLAGGTMLLGMAAGIALVVAVAGNPLEDGSRTSILEGEEEEPLPELSYEEQRQQKLDEMVQMELRRRDLEAKWKALLEEEEAAAEAVRELLPQEEDEESETEGAASPPAAEEGAATDEAGAAAAASAATEVPSPAAEGEGASAAAAAAAAAAATAAAAGGAAGGAAAAGPASSSTEAPVGHPGAEMPAVDFDNLLSSVLDRTKRVIAEGQEMQTATDKGIEELRRKLPQLIKDEINAGVLDLEQVLSGEPPPVDVSRMDQLPSISLILGSLCATAQLTALGVDSLARMAFSGSILAVDLYALWRAHGLTCLSYTFDFLGPDRVVYTFVSVDALMLAFSVAVGARAYLDASAVAAAVAEEQADAPEFNVFGDPEEEFYKQIDHRLINGMKAMLAYDRLTKSVPNRMLPFINIFDFFWQMGSLVVFFDTPGKTCQATFMLEWFRSRGLIFLMGLLPMLTGLGLAVVKASVQSKGFAAALLSAGQAVDAAAFGDGPQLCTIFIKAFWVRDAVDTTTLEMNVLRSEASKLGAELAKARAEAAKCSEDFEAKEAKASAAAEAARRQAELVLGTGRQQEFLNQYRDAINVLISTQQAMAEAHNLAQNVAAGEVPTEQLMQLSTNATSAIGAAVSSGGAGLELEAARGGEEESEATGGFAGSGGTGGG